MVRKPKVLAPNETYTFAKYSELPYAIEDILADLDCTIDYHTLTLPPNPQPLDLKLLQHQIQQHPDHRINQRNCPTRSPLSSNFASSLRCFKSPITGGIHRDG